MSLYTHPGGQVTLLPPPDGYVSDFDHPQRQYVEGIYWASGGFFVLALLFVGQRCFTHFFLHKRFFPEDGLLLIAWLLIILENVLIIRTVADGSMGTHAYELEITKFLEYERDFYPMPIIYPLCCMFAKLSLVCFYTRLSPLLPYRIAAFCGAFFIFGSMFGLTFATAFPCKPLQYAWNPLISGTCIDRPATYKATAIMGLLADIYLIALPIPVIVRLQMPWQQKIGLVAMFGVAVLTVITSIMRLYVIIQQLSDSDVSWGSGPTAFWLIIEAYLMVVCASLPSLRKFFHHVAPKWVGERGSSDNSTPQDENLVTFGGSNKNRKKYRKFDDTLYCLETMHDTDIKSMSHREAAGDVPASLSGDGDSQRGILQTRTATVSISDPEHKGTG